MSIEKNTDLENLHLLPGFEYPRYWFVIDKVKESKRDSCLTATRESTCVVCNLTMTRHGNSRFVVQKRILLTFLVVVHVTRGKRMVYEKLFADVFHTANYELITTHDSMD